MNIMFLSLYNAFGDRIRTPREFHVTRTMMHLMLLAIGRPDGLGADDSRKELRMEFHPAFLVGAIERAIADNYAEYRSDLSWDLRNTLNNVQAMPSTWSRILQLLELAEAGIIHDARAVTAWSPAMVGE